MLLGLSVDWPTLQTHRLCVCKQNIVQGKQVEDYIQIISQSPETVDTASGHFTGCSFVGSLSRSLSRFHSSSWSILNVLLWDISHSAQETKTFLRARNQAKSGCSRAQCVTPSLPIFGSNLLSS